MNVFVWRNHLLGFQWRIDCNFVRFMFELWFSSLEPTRNEFKNRLLLFLILFNSDWRVLELILHSSKLLLFLDDSFDWWKYRNIKIWSDWLFLSCKIGCFQSFDETLISFTRNITFDLWNVQFINWCSTSKSFMSFDFLFRPCFLKFG